MTSKYWLKNRQAMLPWVKNFSNPQDHIRYEKNVRKLKHWDWFWCHPSAYSLIYFGSPILSMLIYLFGAVFCIKRGFGIGMFICPVLFLFMGYRLIVKIRDRVSVKNFTFYDLYLRDFDFESLSSTKSTVINGNEINDDK
jgi:hypothetical protein